MSASGNIEQFLIELGFSDEKAIKGLKAFLGKVDTVNKEAVERTRKAQNKNSGDVLKETKAQKSQNKALIERNKIEAARNIYRNRIVQAKSLGIDTSSEEKSINNLKKIETLKERILAIDTKISKTKLSNMEKGGESRRKLRHPTPIREDIKPDKVKPQKVSKETYKSKIAEAKGLGLDTSSDEKSLKLLRKTESIKKKIADIDERIAKQKALSVGNLKKDVEKLKPKTEPKQTIEKPKTEPNPESKGNVQVARNVYRNKITQAKNLGLDTSSEEKSINNLRKIVSLKERILALDTRISKARLANAELKAQQSLLESDNSVSNAKLKRQREYEAAQEKAYQQSLKRLDQQSEKETKAARDVAKKRKAFQEEGHKLYLEQTERENRKRQERERIAKLSADDEQKRYDAYFKNVEQKSKDQAKTEQSLIKKRKAFQEEGHKLYLKQVDAERQRKEEKARQQKLDADKEQQRLDDYYKKAEQRSADDLKQQQAKAKKIKAFQEQGHELYLTQEANKKKAQKEQDRILDKKAARDRKFHDALMKRADSYEVKLERILRKQGFIDFEKANPQTASAIRERSAGLIASSRMKGRSTKDIELDFISLNEEIKNTTKTIGRHQRALLGLQTIQYGLRDSTRNMVRSYASLFALIAGTSAINKVGQDFEGMRAGMLAVSESAEGAKQNLAFLTAESKRLGLSLVGSSKAFVKLAASAQGRATADEVKEAFTGIAEASTVFQLSADDMTGSIRA